MPIFRAPIPGHQWAGPGTSHRAMCPGRGLDSGLPMISGLISVRQGQEEAASGHEILIHSERTKGTFYHCLLDFKDGEDNEVTVADLR